MNRQQYNQYSMNQYANYTQMNYNEYGNREQGWYTDQSNQQNFGYEYNYNYNNMNQQHQRYRPGFNRTNNNQQNFNLQQNGNYQHSQQNYQNWGYNNNNSNKKKRPHDFVDANTPQLIPTTSQTASPEPKRQLQRQGSIHNNMPYQHLQHQQQQQQLAAHQTQPPNTSKWQVAKAQNQQKKRVGGNFQMEAFHEQKSKEWIEKFDHAISLLSGCRAGEEVNILIANLQPPRAKWVKIKEQIFNDLSRVMTPMGIEKILVFGSTLTGLDFFGSDLDFFIQLKRAVSSEDEIREAIKKAAKLTRCLQGNDFYVICTIPNARVPLIRLLHKASKVTCDVNFNSRFGYYNSYFIGHILGYDKRMKDLAVVLKLWSKAHKLASSMIISNYCLMMLMIFYLQNLEQPMLDTVYNNQRSRSPMILDLNLKWNFYFNDSINKTHNNHLSLRELLVGFFEFYDKINYQNHVISLFTGNLIKRIEFDTLPALEEFRNLIRTNNLQPLKVDNQDAFIVQDGFELNLNIGTKVKKHTDAFLQYIKLSHEKCNELKDSTFSELLVKLYTDIKVAKKEGEGKNKNKKKFQMKIHAIAGDLKTCQDILTHQNQNKICSVEDQQKYFFEHVKEYTEKFLKDVYLCTIVPEVSEDNKTNSMLYKFRVILLFDTINGRKKMSFKDDESFDAEKLLSKKMLEKRIKLDLDILVAITSLDKGKTIDIDMFDSNSSSKKSSLLAFGNYFSINIALALKYYLKKRWEEVMN